MMRRMWINQPLPTDLLFMYHGINVLACPQGVNGYTKVYFLAGPDESLEVPESILVEGWKFEGESI